MKQSNMVTWQQAWVGFDPFDETDYVYTEVLRIIDELSILSRSYVRALVEASLSDNVPEEELIDLWTLTGSEYDPLEHQGRIHGFFRAIKKSFEVYDLITNDVTLYKHIDDLLGISQQASRVVFGTHCRIDKTDAYTKAGTQLPKDSVIVLRYCVNRLTEDNRRLLMEYLLAGSTNRIALPHPEMESHQWVRFMYNLWLDVVEGNDLAYLSKFMI